MTILLRLTILARVEELKVACGTIYGAPVLRSLRQHAQNNCTLVNNSKSHRGTAHGVIMAWFIYGTTRCAAHGARVARSVA